MVECLPEVWNNKSYRVLYVCDTSAHTPIFMGFHYRSFIYLHYWIILRCVYWKCEGFTFYILPEVFFLLLMHSIYLNIYIHIILYFYTLLTLSGLIQHFGTKSQNLQSKPNCTTTVSRVVVAVKSPENRCQSFQRPAMRQKQESVRLHCQEELAVLYTLLHRRLWRIVRPSETSSMSESKRSISIICGLLLMSGKNFILFPTSLLFY